MQSINYSLSLIVILLTTTYAISQDWSDLNNNTQLRYGIAGLTGAELRDSIQWVDENGEPRTAVKLKDFRDNYKVIHGFQAWCPGCHSRGLPTLKKMSIALADNDKVSFMAVQTVFEGAHANTYKRMQEIQKDYALDIPFGHDTGDATTGNRSGTMFDYQTGGTPWFIILDGQNKVVFNDYHLDTAMAIKLLKEATK